MFYDFFQCIFVNSWPDAQIAQVTELKPEWLVEIAPHFYQLKDVEDCTLSFSLSLILPFYVCKESTYIPVSLAMI